MMFDNLIYAYKVVKKYSESSISNTITLHEKEYAREYKNNTIIIALKGSLGLFVFKDLRFAKKFTRYMFSCKIKKVLPLDSLRKYPYDQLPGYAILQNINTNLELENITSEFLSNPNNCNFKLQYIPDGTYVCNSLKVIEDVQNHKKLMI